MAERRSNGEGSINMRRDKNGELTRTGFDGHHKHQVK